MRKGDYLEIFTYDENEFPSIKENLVTWDGDIVRILDVDNKKCRLLASVEDGDDKKYAVYDFNGVAEDDELGRIYVDTSIKKWFNISGDPNNILYSSPYDSESDALSKLKDDEFDTVLIRFIEKH